MRSIVRWALSVATVSLIILSVTAGGREAAAQDGVRQLADALLQFEQHVTWELVSNDWAAQRDNWIAAVQAASTPANVAVQMLALENAMTWQSVDGSWRQRRDGWISEMQSANSASAVARGLLELEQVTLWSAVDGDWRQLRDSWVAGLQSVQ